MMVSDYVPPKVWHWTPAKAAGNVPSLNRPISGATHDNDLPVGAHPFQLYSLASQNGQKATIMFEELLEAGHSGAEYDAWFINIGEGEQFSSGFVNINPNSKIPCLVDQSGDKSFRVFESGAILLHLAETFDAFIPHDREARAECLSWLFWQVAGAPSIGGGFGHFYSHAPIKLEYPINRYAMETKRLCHVADVRLGHACFLAGEAYTIADIAAFPWFAGLVENHYGADTFLSMHEYKNLARWIDKIRRRPAVRRGRLINFWAEGGIRERHSSADTANLGA